MQVVLLERVEKLGQMGQVVDVKNGHARNYLLPQGKALRATKANLARFEEDRAQLEARNLEQKSEAESVSSNLEGQTFVLIRQAGESGQLYGSVSSRDIAAAATDGGFSLGRNQVVLDRTIKSLGLETIRVKLHAEVFCEITINVARTEDEADLQSRGIDVNAQDDEDDVLDADEVFESEEAASAASEAAEEDGEAEEETPAPAAEEAAEEAPAEEEETA